MVEDVVEVLSLWSAMSYCMEAGSSKVEGSFLWELCNSSNTVWKWSMVPERKWDGNFVKDIEIHGESNVWSTAQW